MIIEPLQTFVANGFPAFKDAFILAIVSLVWLFVMFTPLERSFQAHKQKFFRIGWFTDLAFFFGQYLVFAALATAIISYLASPLTQLPTIQAIHTHFEQVPLALQIIAVIMLGDFCAYWGHRLQHNSAFLWRFHSIHHTTEELDWLAAHREHPLDGIYTQTLVNTPAILLGFGLDGVMGLVAFRSLWAIFIHSNVRLNIGPLQYLFGSPALHHWHHAKDRDVGNYANLGPWLDLIFGTYYCPPEEPEEIGVPEKTPKNYLGLLLYPFLPQKEQDPTNNENQEEHPELA